MAQGAKHAQAVLLGMRSLHCFRYHWIRWVSVGVGVPIEASANDMASMMMSSSQQMDRWDKYFDSPKGNRLGVMNNAYNIGSIISFFIV
jgi:hypothetical protein